MINVNLKRNSFFLLLSSWHPDIDHIYQWGTNVCIRVVKAKIDELSDAGTAPIYKRNDESVYVFENEDAPCDSSVINAAVQWYFSYYKIDNYA